MPATMRSARSPSSSSAAVPGSGSAARRDANVTPSAATTSNTREGTGMVRSPQDQFTEGGTG